MSIKAESELDSLIHILNNDIFSVGDGVGIGIGTGVGISCNNRRLCVGFLVQCGLKRPFPGHG